MRARTAPQRSKVLVTIAAALAVLALAPAAGAQTTYDPNRADPIIGSGSDTTYPLMLALDRLYNGSIGCYSEAASGQPPVRDFTCAPDAGRPARPTTENTDHDLALQRFPVGSGNGRSQLRQQGTAGVAEVQYARSSSAPGGSDGGLNFVGYAREAISWVTFRTGDSAGVTNLTQPQLAGIFVNCSIYDWRQLKNPGAPVPPRDEVLANPGANDPIFVYTAQAGSGTRATWDGFVGNNSESCVQSGQASRRVIFENNAAPIVTNGEQENAIFFYSTGRFSQSGGEGTVLGNIEDFAPTTENIRSGDFPYNRLVYNVYRSSRFTGAAGASPAEVVDYMGENGWICKANEAHEPGVGQAIDDVITAQGFVTLGIGQIGGGVSGQSKCRLTAQP